jgi:two-component system, NarL family, nitrate/nitrite response regulator NarL
VVRLRCLIVDDSSDFIDSASRLLESQGLEIVGAASSAAEAVSIAESVHPDVALVDLQLGEENGLEVARLLADRAPSTHVVLISTHSREDLDKILRESPAGGFLPKEALSAAAIADQVH